MAASNQHFSGAGPTTIIHGNANDINSNVTIYQRLPSEPDPIYFNVKSPETNFVGRSTELSNLEDYMHVSTSSSSTSNTIVISGLGGVGKTQIIRKFVQKNRSIYKNVIWIHSERSESIGESFKQLASAKLNIPLISPDGKEKDLNSIIELVLNKLCKLKTLFVYDNVEQIESVTIVLTIEPSGNKPDIIITSRIQEWGDEIEVIHLKVWECDEAIEYVSTALKGEKDASDDKKLLVEKLQYFPLALRQATSFINYQRKEDVYGIGDYLDKYDTKDFLDSELFKKNPCTIYEKTTFTTWRITVEAIEREGATGTLAVRILNIIAYFDPDKIHREIFFLLPVDSENQEREQIATIDERTVKSAVRLLVNYSMVDSQEKQSVLTIHRLVQLVTKLKLEESQQDKLILRDGLKLISKLIETEQVELKSSHSHLTSVFLSALKYSDVVKDFGKLPIRILMALSDDEKYNLAKVFGDKILCPLMTIFGEDDEDILLTRHKISEVYKNCGMYLDALEMNRQVLEKQNNILGEIHVGTLNTRSNIAGIYRDIGRLTEALELFQDVLEKETKNYGEDHPMTLTTKHNMGCTYRLMGKHTEALQLFQEVLKKRESVLGQNHPHLLSTRHNIAFTYRQLGRHAEALRMFYKILEECKITFGNDHHHTLITREKIADIYKELGNTTEALDMQKDIYEKFKNKLGPDHPDTLRSRNGIAEILFQLGKNEEALQIYQEDVEKTKNIFGEDYPDKLATINNLAVIYRKVGKHNEALQMKLKAFEIEKESLGESHSDLMKTRYEIACTYMDLGKHSEALHMLHENLDIQTKVLKDNHPDTLLTCNNIAVTYRMLGKPNEAIQMFKDVLDKKNKILGDHHPETIVNRYNLADTYKEVGKYSEALEVFQEIFEIEKNVFGEDSSDTLTIRRYIANTYLQLKNYSEALKMFEENVAIEINNLGEYHEATLTSRNNIAAMYDKLGKYDEALQLFEDVFEVQKIYLGENHPCTEATRDNIADIYLQLENPTE